MSERGGHLIHPNTHPSSQQELRHRVYPAEPVHTTSCPAHQIKQQQMSASTNHIPGHSFPANQMPGHVLSTNQMPGHHVPTNHIVSQMTAAAHAFGAHSNGAYERYSISHSDHNKPTGWCNVQWYT